MCTAVAQRGGGWLFGRNLDLECGFSEQVTRVPRRVPLRFFAEAEQAEHFAMLGMAAREPRFPLFAEAVNEAGLCAAGLNFPLSARYTPAPSEGWHNIAPHEFIPWLLGQCRTADEAERLLYRTRIVAQPYGARPVPPLHWLIADGRRVLAVEPREGGVRVCEDAAGVLTNEPPFEFQREHLRRHLNLTPFFPPDRFGAGLEPDGQGMGAIGLPGDCSPPSRFVRAAFYAKNSVGAAGKYAAVSQFFHLLGSVEMVRGGVRTAGGACDVTRYSCCIDPHGVYYLRTYGNSRIRAWRMRTEGEELVQDDPYGEEDVEFAN